MILNETEKAYLESEDTSIDNAMIFKELKVLREEVASVKSNTEKKLTKEDILSIKDTTARFKAIEDNMDLFKGMIGSGKYNE